MQGTLLAAAISPDNTPHGYNLTFAFPELMFIIVAAALYLRFRSRHLTLWSTQQAKAAAGRTTTAMVSAPAGAGPAAGGTTSGSTLHEGEAEESPAQEATEQETSEESE